jgi:outer membrane lipoprotein-sorting protein
LVLFLLLSEWIQAQEDVFHYLESIEKRYAGLKDYTTEVNVHFDIETFKTPDMQAKLYYKVPDKMKVESKGSCFSQEKVDSLIPLCSRKRILKSNFWND